MTTTSSDREEFRAGLRAFLQAQSSETDVRALIESATGYDPAVWEKLSSQLGVPAVLVPASAGGQGLSYVELAVALEESGRALLTAPVLSSSGVATTALRLARTSPEVQALLGEMATGELIGTLAIPTPGGSLSVDGDAVSGSAGIVMDGQIADRFLVLARDCLFSIPAENAGVRLEPIASLDITRRQQRLELDGAKATLLDRSYAGAEQRLFDIAAILACAEMLGCAQRALEIAVDYAKVREQFGKTIGSFQAVKHLLADSLAKVEQMRGAVAAGVTAASEDAELGEVASVVKAYCSTASAEVVQTLIQVLGGIGYTWEHPAHLYLRRVRTLGMFFGTPADHKRRLAARFSLTGV